MRKQMNENGDIVFQNLWGGAEIYSSAEGNL